MYALLKRFITSLLVMRRFFFCVLILIAANAFAVSTKVEADDEIFVIEEDNSNEPIVKKEASLQELLANSVVFRSDFFLQGSYQLVHPLERPVRVLGSAWGTLGFAPSDIVSLQLSAIARVPVDFSWQASPAQFFDSKNAFLDLYDSFIKIQSAKASLSVGYLRIPWVNTRGAAVLDRLNPVDYRRSQDFTSTILGRIPQVGAYYQTSAFGTSVDAVILLHYSPSQGSLVASEQSGVQIGRYQGALFPNQTQMGTLSLFDRQTLLLKEAWLQTPVLALRAKKQVSDTVDMGAMVSWGFNEVPSLALPSKISHERLLNFGLDLSVSLGVAVLKSELLVEPKFSDWGGKTTILRSPAGTLRSMQLPSFTFVIAADAEYGDLFSGSLELVDTVWMNVPQNEYVLGVESLQADVSFKRALHRLALAGVTQSTFLNKKMAVCFKGELGLTQPDILARVDLTYQWESLGLYAGVYGTMFSGIKGSPGWFRQDATSFGLYIGHKI